MRGFALGLSFSIAFIIGCMARPYVVPPARANQQVQKWEYFCFIEGGELDVQRKANKAGKRGWEMASVAAASNAVGNWCFKRPL
jgi:hypothetical protein